MNGAELIASERARHLSQEGWSAEHDAQYVEDELIRASSAYLTPQEHRPTDGTPPASWPWDPQWFKPGSLDNAGRIRELQKAGALIAAEIDRLLAADDRKHSIPA